MMRKLFFFAVSVSIFLASACAPVDKWYSVCGISVDTNDFEPPSALELVKIRENAEKGDLSSEIILADFYYKSLKSKYEPIESDSQNAQQAAYWMRKAADQGDTGSQMTLANLYFNGVGVKKNFLEADFWARNSSRRYKTPHCYAYDIYTKSEKNLSIWQREAVSRRVASWKSVKTK